MYILTSDVMKVCYVKEKEYFETGTENSKRDNFKSCTMIIFIMICFYNPAFI